MFSVAPKHVELTIVPKKGRKNKDIALKHFEDSIKKIGGIVKNLDNAVKDPEARKQPLRGNLREALREIKEVEKLLTRYEKIQYKPKRTRESHNTGLKKLRPISEGMALFAKNWEYGVTQKSRYDVTNLLCSYIKDNELRDPDNGTIIIPDAKLKELLQLEDDVVLRYPTMQKYLKNCFEEVVIEPSIENQVVEEKDNKRGRKVKETKVVEEVKKPVKKEKETKAKKEPKKK